MAVAEVIDEGCMLCTRSTAMALHDECMLRSVLGGIGHLLDCTYWCGMHDDPDAGLTFRESALCVAQLVQLFGSGAVGSGRFERIPLDELRAMTARP